MGWIVVWMVIAGFVLLVAAIAYGFLAPLKVHFPTTLAPGAATPRSGPEDRPFVGLALSGGGARAAVFAAAGMQALHARGLLETVSHVSSVSGGGFAASYLALHPVQEAASPEAYFARMLDVMAQDYFREVQLNQLRHPDRVFSPSRRLISLTEALDGPEFLRAARFADLPGDRKFFFNAVCYDTGQRFVFSDLALPAPEVPEAGILPAALRAMSFSDETGQRPTPGNLPLSLAVATSAAFPPYLGPMTVQIAKGQGEAAEFWHLGDGGVLENTGIETLREAVYARGDGQKATIYVFNAGQRLDQDLSKNTHDISIFSRDVTRLVDVLLEYATAHRDTLFAELDARFGMQIEVIEFDYMDVARLISADDPADADWFSWRSWPHSTHAERMASKTPADHLARIPTALRISPNDRQMIAAAAAYLVRKRLAA